MNRKSLRVLVVALVTLSLIACGGPEEKKVKFFNRARDYFTQGELEKARIEVKNAIQIDPKYAEAYHLLGQIELRDNNPRGAYEAFGQAVEHNP